MAARDLLDQEKRYELWRHMKHAFQRKRDQVRRIVGRKLFDYVPQVQTPCLIAECQRVVLVRWDAKFGDAIVSSFLFRELRKANPDISIEVITTEALAPLFTEHWQADRVHICNKRAGYLELDRLAREMGSVDLLIHFSKELKPKDLFFLKRLQPAHVAGLDDDPSSVDIKLREQCAGMHFSDKLAHLLRLCGVAAVDTSYWIPHDEQSREAVQASWPARYRHVVAFNPYGAGQARRLSEESICKVLSLLRTRGHQYGVCLLHSPEEREDVERIVERFRSQGVFHYPASRSILDVIAQIEMADAVISVDTATVHIAAGLGKPLLGFYNPDVENYADWGPNNLQALSLFSIAARPFDVNSLNWQQVDEAISLLMARSRHSDEMSL